MIAEMHGKGIPVELIVSAVATFEEAMAARAVSTVSPVDTSTIDKRRAWDRERKRRQRASANSTGLPPYSAGIPPDGDSILTSLSISPKEVKEKKESKKVARGTRIPPDFSIDDEDRKFAASIGLPPDTVEAETPQFIDYWSSVSGRHGVKINWKATWRNRMRDLVKYRGRGNFNGTSQAKSGSSLIAALDRKLAALETEDGPDYTLPESSLLRISG
jgi:hypothetical protein